MTLRVSAPSIAPSPARPAWTRWSVRVQSDRDGLDETAWLDVPPTLVGALSPRGEAALLWFAPVAAMRGEALVLAAPTDATLVAQVREVTRVWRRWFPALQVPDVEAPSSPAAPQPPRRVGAMFTGGVDGFFTVLRHAAGEGTPQTEAIDDCCFVVGFDVPVANVAAADRIVRSLDAAAAALGRALIAPVTNLRETVFGKTDWARVSHGAALAGVAHALAGGYHTFLIGSTAAYDDPKPWGSHPLTDPWFSSPALRILHDGAAFIRAEKLAYIAKSPVALAHLRVCWKSERGDNCGACNKCLRTMLTLEALGVLGDCATFDRRQLDLAHVARVYCREEYDVRHFRAIRELAVRVGRRDLVAAIDQALEGSATLTRRLAFVRGLRDRRVIGRWAPEWEATLLRGWIV